MKFSTWLQDHARGDLDEELSDALLEVANGVLMVDKKPGTVTLTINVTKSGRMIVISGEVKTKIPKGEAEASMMYVGENGLTKDDPYQLRAFDRGNGPLYEVGPDGVLRDVDTGEEKPPANADGEPVVGEYGRITPTNDEET